MTSTLERERSSAVDPRIAARREAVEADRRRIRVRRWAVLAAAIGLLVGAWYLTRTPLLDVDRIEVVGAVQTPIDAIAETTGIRPGAALLELDRAAAAARVRALPWIDTAVVERNWDGRIVISVTERDMVAIVDDDSGVGWLVDASGRVLAEDGTMDGIDTRIVGAVAGAPGSTVSGIDDALRVAALLSPGMRSRVATIAIGPDGSLTLGLRPQGTVVLGPPTDLAAKVTSLRTVMAQVDQRDLASINVVNPGTPVVVRTPRTP